ncbi:MAG: ATP-binding protein [Acidimicrobiales bacterium]
MVAVVIVLAIALAAAVAVIVVLLGQLNAAAAPVPAPVEAPVPAVPEEPSLSRLVAALDALSLGVVVADADEVLGFQNRSAQAILSSRDSRSIINRAVRELLVAAVRGESGEREIDLFGPPKATYLIRAVPLAASPGQGVPGGGGSVAVVEDITERRRTDQVRRDFVSNISHELKTPVGALGLLAETLRDETDLQTIRRFTERMGFEVARLSRTIDDLLELSRIEFGDDLFIDEGPVGAMVEEAVGRFRSAAEARGIELRTGGDTSVVVRCDGRQVTSAVSNLVDNAVKYSPDGASVSVDVSATDTTVSIRVSDTGDGIPTRDLDRVFERFYRVDRARSRDTGGTGLGLAIVRHVAQNHGGEVSVRSKEGQGSEFTLTLPLAGPHGRVDQQQQQLELEPDTPEVHA